MFNFKKKKQEETQMSKDIKVIKTTKVDATIGGFDKKNAKNLSKGTVNILQQRAEEEALDFTVNVTIDAIAYREKAHKELDNLKKGAVVHTVVKNGDTFVPVESMTAENAKKISDMEGKLTAMEELLDKCLHDGNASYADFEKLALMLPKKQNG